MEGEPVPGLDIKLGKNPGGMASAALPLARDDDTPDGGDDLDPMAGAGSIITTRSNIKNGGSVTSAEPSGAPPDEGTPPPPDDESVASPRRPNGKRGWYRSHKGGAKPQAPVQKATGPVQMAGRHRR